MKKTRDELKASKEQRRIENIQNRSALAGIMSSTGRGMKISMHNAMMCLIYGMVMFLVFYVALQVAFYGVAFLAGSTGAFAMETAADVLTIYVIVAMVCGFCLFFSFGAEKMVIRALKRRLWRSDNNGGIDRGEAWRKRHEEA